MDESKYLIVLRGLTDLSIPQRLSERTPADFDVAALRPDLMSACLDFSATRYRNGFYFMDPDLNVAPLSLGFLSLDFLLCINMEHFIYTDVFYWMYLTRFYFIFISALLGMASTNTSSLIPGSWVSSPRAQ
jgi:hypothetical protein